MSGPRRRNAEAQRGQTAVLILVGFLIATLFLLAGFEITRLVSRNLGAQNSADGAARAAATWQARGLNIIGTANIAEALLMIEFVLPYPRLRAFDPVLGEAGREIAALQDTVATLFPSVGLLAASAVAREAGAAPLSAAELRQAGFDKAADWLENIAAAGELGELIAASTHAAPLARDDGVRMLSLGVRRAGRQDLATLIAAVLGREGAALDLIFGQLGDPLFATAQAPVLLLGDHGLGEYDLTLYPGAEADVMLLRYRVGPSKYETARVLTHRGIVKLRRTLGQEPRRTLIGYDKLAVVPAYGPLDADRMAAEFRMSKAELARRGIERAIEAALGDPHFGFGFYVYDEAFWASGGASATVLIRHPGWTSPNSTVPRSAQISFARAAPVSPGRSPEGLVLPVFESVGLEQVEPLSVLGGRR